MSAYGLPINLDEFPEENWRTCRERVLAARTALHELVLGNQVVSTSYDGRTVVYSTPDIERVEAYIARLCQSCPDGYRSADDYKARRPKGRARAITWLR